MAYQITEEEYKEIVLREKQTRDKRISKRLRVLMLRYEGKSNPEIAAKLDISTDRLSHLISEYKRVGLEEYVRVKYTGNHRNMSYEEEQEILDRFQEAAKAGQVITVKEIKAAFDEKLGRDTGRGYIYMLLKRHRWRKLKPRSRHPKKASDEEIAASKKLKPSWKKLS
jgi:transposase